MRKHTFPFTDPYLHDKLSHMRQNSTICQRLSHIPLFAGISAEAIEEYLGGDTQLRRYQRGEVIFSPSRYIRALGFVLEGSALVYKVGEDERRLLMSRLVRDDVFGMASLFYEREYPTEIVAEHACAVLLWPKERLEAAFSREARLSANYITLLSERIHFLNRRIESLSGDDPAARLLRVLDTLRDEAGARDGMFELSYSLSQLAQMLGIGRATLYRTLDALEAQGTLRRDGKRIAIVRETEPDGWKRLDEI